MCRRCSYIPSGTCLHLVKHWQATIIGGTFVRVILGSFGSTAALKLCICALRKYQSTTHFNPFSNPRAEFRQGWGQCIMLARSVRRIHVMDKIIYPIEYGIYMECLSQASHFSCKCPLQSRAENQQGILKVDCKRRSRVRRRRMVPSKCPCHMRASLNLGSRCSLARARANGQKQ